MRGSEEVTGFVGEREVFTELPEPDWLRSVQREQA